ncbi:MAG: xanthine dehydrogenase subunit D [Acidimicrobiales bacterium]
MTRHPSSGATLVRPARGGLGTNTERPDGRPKVRGEFAFSSDLWSEGALWGQVLRSPHASARIIGIDTSAARVLRGVRAVLVAEDVPGSANYGLEFQDQPVFASEVVRYMGEPVAAVAADHPEIARRALELIDVSYDVLVPLVDPEAAIDAPSIHPDGNVVRAIRLRHGTDTAEGPAGGKGVVVVEGVYEVGMQDQAFMGPESGLAIPDGEGGVDLYISTQWLHVDRDQVAACLGLSPAQVRLHLAGVGGAFGAREDVSLQVHICLLALRTGRPVKVVYSREESFFGHVHRHPARMWYRHSADRAGGLVKVEARIVLDGGAYASSSSAVVSNAACFAGGPYRVPNARVDAYGVRTNNPPCGAMRGFGAVQVCVAYEAQMDKLAAVLGLDPVEIRLRNALAPGDRLITGQLITGRAPVREVIEQCAATPLPHRPEPAGDEPAISLPGGAGRTAKPGRIHRGVGFAVGYKNLMYSEGFDDYSSARCRIDRGVVTVSCAAAEVGQGFVTLVRQIALDVFGTEEVIIAPAATTTVGSAGSTSASRQTWMSGGAVDAACRRARDVLLTKTAELHGLVRETLELVGGHIIAHDGSFDQDIASVLGSQIVDELVTFRHAPTMALDGDGQGDAHVSFTFAAHRAVVDVDVDLGLVRVVEIATAQDVGRVLNPLQVIGQIEGGIAQGVGLAVMEEILVANGLVQNPSFTDYLIPTALDMPAIRIAALIEQPEPGAPFGAKGVGEAPTISSTAAVAAAIRSATGLELVRVPIRPEHIALAASGRPR